MALAPAAAVMHNQPCQRADPTETNEHEALFSCVLPVQSGWWDQHQSAVERGLSAFGMVFWSGGDEIGSRSGSPWVDPDIREYPHRAGSSPAHQTKASSPVRAQMTPANGLHGLNPRNTGHRDPRCSVQPFRQGLRNLSGQSGGNDLFGNEWLPQGTLGFGWERVGCQSTLAWTMEKSKVTDQRLGFEAFCEHHGIDSAMDQEGAYWRDDVQLLWLCWQEAALKTTVEMSKDRDQ